MRVLHVVKTADGADWAVLQVTELVRRGVQVHVAVPSLQGGEIENWRASGARLHMVPLDYPVRAPWRLASLCREARELVQRVKPDLIHSHFVGTTLVLRRSFGKKHPLPRVFQVPGPLHLEHGIFRTWELATAGAADHWIASSRFVKELYLRYGVDADRVFLSYYGTRPETFQTARRGALRKLLGLSEDAFVVGNMNYMYAPKRYLGQRKGLKCHEDIIRVLSSLIGCDPKVEGVLVGGAYRGALWYEERLRRLAASCGHGRIHMPGTLPHAVVREAWPDFDVVIHAPLSENCGGVLEPMLVGVPVVAARVGGIPELVHDGVTGTLVDSRCPEELAAAVLRVRGAIADHRALAARGRQLAAQMFDVRRTADEVLQLYRHILDRPSPVPPEFDGSALIAASS